MAACPLNVPELLTSTEVPEPVNSITWPLPEPVPAAVNGMVFACLRKLVMAAARGKVVAGLVPAGGAFKVVESEPPPPQAASINAAKVAETQQRASVEKGIEVSFFVGLCN
jgi:hypothetical protein